MASDNKAAQVREALVDPESKGSGIFSVDKQEIA